VILHYFLAKKSCTEIHRILEESYGEHAPSKTSCTDPALNGSSVSEAVIQKSVKKVYGPGIDGPAGGGPVSDP